MGNDKFKLIRNFFLIIILVVIMILTGCSDVTKLFGKEEHISDAKHYIGTWTEESGDTGISFTFNQDKTFEVNYKFKDFPGSNRMGGNWLTTEFDVNGVTFVGIILYRHYTEVNGTVSYFETDNEKMKEEYIVGFFDEIKGEMLLKRADKNYFYNLKKVQNKSAK